MIYISHRGNVNGKIPNKENHPDYIKLALSNGYDVEIDVWYDNGYWLGHDEPTYNITKDFLLNNKFGLIQIKCYTIIVYVCYQN